jgi:hypothetical protein
MAAPPAADVEVRDLRLVRWMVFAIGDSLA